MDLVASVEVPVSVEKLFDYVADLANYSSWLEFVHKVELVGESTETDATWYVELRAKLGVLARSKRLRMTRTLCEHPKLVVFERREQDSRRHSEWILRATVSQTATGAKLETNLHYSGNLFTGGMLERALSDQIATGREKLIQQLSAK
jgi:ribosome-associated toxin RatA of RatAB toxin-antitoxin module